MSEKKGEISQEILDEAMVPSLSEDFFTFEGKKVQIKPLQIKHQIKFAKIMSPFVDSLALDMSASSLAMGSVSMADGLIFASSALKHAEVLPKLIQVLCQNDGFDLSDEALMNSTMQPEEMQDILARYFAKKGEIEGQVANFFMNVLPKGKQLVAGALKEINEKLLDEAERITTALLQPSPKNGDGLSNTPTL